MNDQVEHTQQVPVPNTNPLEFKTFKDNNAFVQWQDGTSAKIHQVSPVSVDKNKVYLTIVYQVIS